MVSHDDGRAWAGVPPAEGPLSTSEVGKLLQQHHVPGAGLAILDAGEIRAAYSYGFARDMTPVNESTRFQAGSISKTIDALLVLTLVRDRLVGLDDPVNTHLKTFTLRGPDADRVTPRMLLSHTGGVSVRGFTGYERGHSTPSLHQILAGEAPANSDAINVVGSLGRFDYSGGGIMVLQQLIVDVTGQSYDDAAKRRVLTPLGMSDSGFEQPPSENGASNFAHAHALDGRPVPGGYNIYPELAAAGLWTTASDLCRVMHAISTSLAGRPGALFPEPIARQMVTPVDGNAALGVFIGSDGAIVHGGRNRGFSALYKLALSKGRGVAVMTNRHDAEQARLELVERALAHEL
jgi:CubicO group peptidase (beta-lactamase class C family)